MGGFESSFFRSLILVLRPNLTNPNFSSLFDFIFNRCMVPFISYHIPTIIRSRSFCFIVSLSYSSGYHLNLGLYTLHTLSCLHISSLENFCLYILVLFLYIVSSRSSFHLFLFTIFCETLLWMHLENLSGKYYYLRIPVLKLDY